MDLLKRANLVLAAMVEAHQTDRNRLLKLENLAWLRRRIAGQWALLRGGRLRTASIRDQRRIQETTTARRVHAAFGATRDRARWIVHMTVDHFFAVLNLMVGLACLYLELRRA